MENGDRATLTVDTRAKVMAMTDDNSAPGAYRYRMAFTRGDETIEADPGVGNGGPHN